MKFIIVGCGNMGRTLVKELSSKGEVVIIDREEKAIASLEHPCTKVVGIGFDKDVLEKASIETAEAVIACTDSDETNALIARVAWEKYHVPQTIARLEDPRKAVIYDALGIKTISSTKWGVAKIVQSLSYGKLDIVYEIGNGGVSVVRVVVPHALVGQVVAYFNASGETKVMGLERNNRTTLPVTGEILQAGDILYISVQANFMNVLKEKLVYQGV